MSAPIDMRGAIAAIKRLYELADCMTPAENNAALRAIAFLEDGSTERSLAELTGRVIEDEGSTEVSITDLVELGLWRGPDENDDVGASLPSDGNSDARPAASTSRSGALSQVGIVDIAVIEWREGDKTAGWSDWHYVEQWLENFGWGFGDPAYDACSVIDSDRTAFRIDSTERGEPVSIVVIATIDRDADGIADGWRDLSRAVRVEVIRC